MYTFIAHQAPSGPTGLKVNPLLFKIYMNTYGTWSLPHHGTLCIIRYEGDRRQAAKEIPGGQGEGPQGHKEEDGAQQELDRRSQATPCARAPETPCARATQRVCAGAPHAHEPVPCPRDPRAHGPNLHRAHGLIRMDDRDLHSEPLFLHFVPMPIYSVPRTMFRVSKGYVRHMRALLHGSTPLGDQDLLLE